MPSLETLHRHCAWSPCAAVFIITGLVLLWSWRPQGGAILAPAERRAL